MKVFSSLKQIKKTGRPSAVTIGVFDGVHLGHRRLIRQTINCAKKFKGQSAVITFKGHPDLYPGKKSGMSFIKSDAEKLRALEKQGVDVVAMLDFAGIRGMEAGDFVKKALVDALKARCVVAGRDFRFGKGGAGNTALLKELGEKHGFKVVIPRDFKVNGRRVSSTLIRQYLKKGDIKAVKKMLGKPYAITGKVVRGRRAGFVFPTANLKLAYGDAPARGVWAVKVIHKSGSYFGAANIGFAPTIKNLKDALLEVFILDFNRDIYGDELRVVFLERLRPEKKFKSRDALISQVKKDIGYIRKKYLKRPAK
jgi:riboflavin kinase / FMN adenylyltransferase